MANDYERREVAEALRHSWPKVADERAIKRSIKVYIAIYEALCSDNEHLDCLELLNRLADLIDPDCEEGRYEGVHTARPVDREKLLGLADKMSRYASLRQRHGMDVDTIAVRAWVLRIREACGEVVE